MTASSSPFRALGNYTILPQLIGWPSLVIAFLARAPYAMIPLGVMTAFTAASGSVSIGGLATAAVSLSTAFASPLIGRAADVWGQRRLLVTLIPLNAAVICGLFLTSLQDGPGWYMWPLCVLVGLTGVPIGSFTRARWVAKTSTPYQISTAFGYESMADELVFVLGPALVGIAASAAAPSAPLAVAFVLMLVAGIPFALTAPGVEALAQPGQGPQSDRSSATATARPSIFRVLWQVLPSVLILVAVGTYFGSTQAATTLRAEVFSAPGQAGLVYAVMGIGSAITSLLVVMIPERISLSTRILVCALGMAALMTIVAFQGSLGTTALFLGFAGVWVGPTLVTAFTMTERLAPAGGISVALTAMSSSVTVGVSLGSGLGGSIASNFGDTAAYGIGVAAGLVIFLLSVILKGLGSRGRIAAI